MLLRMAPHIIHPLRFVLPTEAGQPFAHCCCGWDLCLYDHLGKRKNPAANERRSISRMTRSAGRSSIGRRASRYSDCWVDDARCSSSLNALDAAERGASIRTGARVVRVERGPSGGWASSENGRRTEVTRARARQRRRAMDRRCHRRRAASAAAAGAAGQGQPHRRAQTVRSRPRLYFSGARRARDLRHSYRRRDSR